jgi:dihydrofolate reductase
MPRYVISATLEQSELIGGTILRGDVVTEITRLKQRYEGDIVVYGSIQLARTMIDHRLADQVRLTVHPYILGGGEHLLDGVAARTSLRMISAETIGTNLVHLIYDIS